MKIGYCLTHLQDNRRAVQSCYVFERSHTHYQGRNREDCHWTYIYSPKHFSLGLFELKSVLRSDGPKQRSNEVPAYSGSWQHLENMLFGLDSTRHFAIDLRVG